MISEPAAMVRQAPFKTLTGYSMLVGPDQIVFSRTMPWPNGIRMSSMIALWVVGFLWIPFNAMWAS